MSRALFATPPPRDDCHARDRIRMKLAPVAAILAFIACGGCSIALDENTGAYAAQPATTDLLDCPALPKLSTSHERREADLCGLAEDAGHDPSGAVLAALFYGNQLNLLRAPTPRARKPAD